MPLDMSVLKAPPECLEAMEGIALDIFTDMSNAGHSFRETVAAIYLSGMAHAVSFLTKDPS